jgi:PBP1b-binding outer membrane lipoprotein LpoB
MRTVLVPVALTTAAVLMAACSSHAPAPTADSSAQPVPAGALPDRQGEMGELTAKGLVDALNQAGFAAPNLVNVTAQDCPAIGCVQSVVTDTLRAKSFATTGQAEIYAKDHDLFQVTTIVVTFAPPMTPADQDRYRAEIQKLVD